MAKHREAGEAQEVAPPEQPEDQELRAKQERQHEAAKAAENAPPREKVSLERAEQVNELPPEQRPEFNVDPHEPMPVVQDTGEWQVVGMDKDGVRYERNARTFARRAVGAEPETGVYRQAAWLTGGNWDVRPEHWPSQEQAAELDKPAETELGMQGVPADKQQPEAKK